MELKIINNKGQEAGIVEFNEGLVQTKASKVVLHEIVVAHNANQRMGTHESLTRSDVQGSGAKPWKQKGTGNARAGDKRSPLWRKGGTIFGPHQRDYRVTVPKKKKKLAFKMAFREVLNDNRLQVVDPIVVTEPKTKLVASIYSNWKAPSGSFFIVDKIESKYEKASRNISTVVVCDVNTLNTYDCLKARRIFITKIALEQLTKRIGAESEN